MKGIRIGQSSDIHKLAVGLPLILGGERIDHSKGCVAHSDGDALVHAITESIIGALGLGDLGTFYSDTDDRNKGRNSLEMLAEINELMIKKGYKIINIDSLIMLEQPKLKKYSEKMRKNIANSLQIDYNLINIKSTRGEEIGFIGREEGIMAQAVVLLQEDEKQ